MPVWHPFSHEMVEGGPEHHSGSFHLQRQFQGTRLGAASAQAASPGSGLDPENPELPVTPGGLDLG